MKFPDLSKPRALSDDAQPVLLNGMKVVFDQKVALYPVRLSKKKKEEAAGASDERPN